MTATAPARQERMLDTRVAIGTPEGVALTLSPAGPVPRAAAWLIDQLLRLGIYLLAAMLLAFLQKAGGALLMLLVFLLEWFYPVLFEVLNRGATPGKVAIGIAVVELDGKPVGWSSSTVRNFLRVADFLPLLYCFGLLSMLSTRRFQRLGDIAAGTLVVHRGNLRSKAVVLPDVAPRAPAVALTRDEEHALVALANRHRQLSGERLDELAAIAPALTGSDRARQREHLLAVARHLAGDDGSHDGTSTTPPPADGAASP